MSSGAALTAAHLERAAYVYIRQSSDVQVKTNVERQRLQYALSDHAKELGFHDIEVIDEDLGISSALSIWALPVLTTCFGPRTELAGLKGRIWPTTSQSKSIRSVARCCFTLAGASTAVSCST